MTYLDWLKYQIEYFDTKYPHNKLLDTLHEIAFRPIIDRDANRAGDGIALRDMYDEFCNANEPYNATVINGPCSFLEFLYALARRMGYIYSSVDEDRTRDMFWLLINNMGLGGIDDAHMPMDRNYIYERARIINHREYSMNGEGGLFPLKNARENQRNVEIWYQMNQYLNELMRDEGRI